MKYGLLGHPLSHSMSPFIHKELFRLKNIEAEYFLYDYESLNNENIENLKKLDGFNITIPYKNEVIKFLSDLDYGAKRYSSVNTVKNENKNHIGYNTDVFGFLESIKMLKADLSKKVLILGYGGVARMVCTEIVLKNGTVFVAARKKSLGKALKFANDIKKINSNAYIEVVDINNITVDFETIINCTPVGMYPNMKNCPIEKNVIKKSKFVFDMIYNPKKTELLEIAERNNISCLGGMHMLVLQAAKAHNIWYGAEFADSDIKEIVQKANDFMEKKFARKPLAIIGFMASGKTSLSREIAKDMGIRFIDLDEEIVKQEKLDINTIFWEKGEEYFRNVENNLLKKFINCNDCIISCGGGIIKKEENRILLKNNCKTFFVDTPFEICYERIQRSEERPLAQKNNKNKLLSLYEERMAYYIETSDFIINGTKSIEKQIEEIKNS